MVYIKDITSVYLEAGLLEAKDDGDRDLEKKGGLDFSGLIGKKPWAR